MKKKVLWFILIGVFVAAIITGILLMGRDVTVVVNGQTVRVHTYAVTVRQLLRGMGYSLSNGDSVNPAPGTWLANVNTITLDRSHEFALWVGPNGKIYTFTSSARTPRELLSLAGIEPAEDDVVKIDGIAYGMDEPLPNAVNIALQYIPAIPLSVSQDGNNSLIRSTGPSLGKALWSGGIHLNGAQGALLPFNLPLQNAQEITLTKPTQLSIQVDGAEIRSFSSATTVGQALQNSGITLQNLDYSLPSDNSPLPADGIIRVVRVREEVKSEQESLPFKVSYQPDSTLALDQRKEITAGQYGIAVSRVVIRYEDGVEVSRNSEESITLVPPVDQVVAYGTKIEYQTLNTGFETITYYRTAVVHVTSYSPCRLAPADGSQYCNTRTASGATLTNGIIATTYDWFQIFQGTQIYIPGYGIGQVEDVGGGIPGEYWIDLGYTDEDWVSWSSYVTVYFIAPAPANVPGILP
jgi:uncharacterized protein YabE (DUF348 family)/3D (Asp-Asp-Asp) domain-containing protein